MPSCAPLPQKENAAFKKLLKCYEQKQYKTGLKCARQILSNPKFAEHGETLAMKGLILNSTGKKEEAYDHVKRGLRNDLRSHVCWHVFGLLQRSDRKYDEAIKAYRNALRHDKDNLQILRDLSLLQILLRDYEGYLDTRHRLLELRPAQRASWIGYGMAYHLLSEYDMAFKVLDEFRKTQQYKPYEYEYSELVLYQTTILLEAGKRSEALKFLEDHDKKVVDRLYVEETKAHIYMKEGDRSKAEAIYRRLLDRNPENWKYYSLLEEALEATEFEERLGLYTDILKEHPWATAPKKLPLNFATGADFRQHLDSYLRYALTKGIPSLFISMRALYKDPEKVTIIEEVMLGYERSLKDGNLYHPDDSAEESPTTLLWVQAYLGQHYDHLGHTQKALDYIAQPIKATPTLPELFLFKGRIHKHSGNLLEAVKSLDEAQSLDTADRYINCKCAKFMLRANLVGAAEAMCAGFTREGVGASENLNEMQCMWYQTEVACAHQRLGEWGQALKKCHEVDKHFTEITEDQFDFHTYCLRKMTLRSYIGLLRLEDTLRNHRFYFKAARVAIEIYLHLYEHPITDSDSNVDGATENMNPKELKKLRNKMRKKQKKAEAEAAAAESTKDGGGAKGANKDAAAGTSGTNEEGAEAAGLGDLDPKKLAKPEAPLEEAIRFLKPLQSLCSDNIETHVLAFEIYYRKDKLLLMLQAIRRGHSLKVNDPRFHVCKVKFLKKVDEASDLSASVTSVLHEGMQEVYTTTCPLALNNGFIEAHGSSLPHRMAGAISMYLLESSQQDAAVALATDLSDDLSGRNHKNCEKVYVALKKGELGSCPTETEEYRASCHRLFPFNQAFFPEGYAHGLDLTEEEVVAASAAAQAAKKAEAEAEAARAASREAQRGAEGGAAEDLADGLAAVRVEA